MEIRSTLVLAVLLVLSGFVHMGVWVALGLLPPIEQMLASQNTEVEMVVLPPPDPEPEPVAEEPEPDPEPEPPEPEVVEPPPEPDPPPRPRPEPQDEPPPPPPDEPPPDEPPPEEPPAAEEAIADFTGETMVAEGPGAFVTATGNGEAMQGPIGQPGAQVTGRRRSGNPNGTPGGRGDGPPAPRVLPAADLSRQARPPNQRLVEILRRNYPSRARDLGIEGDAVVRVQVNADGSVRPLSVVSEDYEGFGAACRQSLRQSPRWEPPADRQGQPAATRLNFRCTFTIR